MNFQFTKKKSKISIILPTYNERGNIIDLIYSILNYCKNIAALEIIVVDDNSPDGTADFVRQRFKKRINVKLVVRTENRGLASAIKAGIKKATGNYIVVMDTDFNHDPKELLNMFTKIGAYQLVIGSRYVGGGGMENKLRQWLSYLFNIYLRIILGHGVHDNLSGYFMISRKDLFRLNVDKIFYGFGDYFMRLIFQAHQMNFTICEVPIYYKNRTYGYSKSHFLQMFISYTLSAVYLRLGFV